MRTPPSRLSPPNGGGTSCINGVSPPFGGFCHPRETDLHGLTPRGKRSVAPLGAFGPLAPLQHTVTRCCGRPPAPGCNCPSPLGHSRTMQSAGDPLSLSEKVSSPPADLYCVPGGNLFPADQSVAVFPALAPGVMLTRLSVRPSGKSRQYLA